MTASAPMLLTPWSVLTATAGLIAFHIGLYTLVGRERKSPYVINAVLPVFLLCLAVATLALCSILTPQDYSERVLYASIAILVVAFAWSIFVVYRTTVRFVYFVDSVGLRHLPGIRHLRRWRTLNSSKPTFSHSPMAVDPALKSEIVEIFSDITGEGASDVQLPLTSIAIQAVEQSAATQVLVRLAVAFLKRNCCVQYLTASRHPIDFVEALKGAQTDENEWRNWARNVVVIDAYSPHFAFIDSIYTKKDREIASYDVQRITSKMTYAGIHTASSEAFNLFQKGPSDNVRRPTLVIYEGTYALSDLESAEQYRIFLRHVIPSEKLWGGMLTVFLESSQNSVDWDLLRAYATLSGKIPKPDNGPRSC